ncbi:MAG: hypothetical protein HY925_09260 [Elusimicrobia bacterium]|nr:hypothetical protein [Elusimicrobiota bacterium]
MELERLEPRLRASALMVLRDHGVGADDLVVDLGKPRSAPASLITGHRIRIQLDDRSATFRVLAGRWSGLRADYPTAGAFVAALEKELGSALSGR